MFLLNNELREKIFSRLKSSMTFCSISEVSCEEDCSCKGGCGTYTPPCSCCAYN